MTAGAEVTNTVTPAFVAKRAGTPLLIIGGQVPTPVFDRGAVLAADHLPILASVTEWSALVHPTERIPEYVETAWRRIWASRQAAHIDGNLEEVQHCSGGQDEIIDFYCSFAR